MYELYLERVGLEVKDTHLTFTLFPPSKITQLILLIWQVMKWNIYSYTFMIMMNSLGLLVWL